MLSHNDNADFFLPEMTPQRQTFLLYFAACLAAILVYLPGLSGPFLFDDNGNIVDNTSIQIMSLSWAALADSLSGPTAGPLGRPISVLSFALTHYAFGLDPFAFKAINLFIHLLNGFLVTLLFRMVLRHSGLSVSQATREWLPLWVGVVWVLHPINVIPVLMAVQRMTLLAGLFTLLALICHIQGLLADRPAKRVAWMLIGWGIAWPLAALSKETAILFPLYALILSWALVRTIGISDLRRITLPGLTAAVAIALAFMAYLGADWLERGYEMRTFSLHERILTELRVLWFYCGQILVPSHAKFGLFLDDFQISRGVAEPVSTAVAMVGWLAVLLACAMLLRRQHLIALSILWFLVGHSLESSFLPLEIAHEYRNYLPSLGLIFACGLSGVVAMQRMGERQGAKALIITLGCVAVVLASTYTWMRSMQYGDGLEGAQMEVSYHPRSPRANYEAAAALMKNGYGAQGDPLGEVLVQYHFREAGKLDPSFKLGYLGLIMWACASERPLDTLWLDELEQRLKDTPFGPKDRDLAADLLPPLLANKSCIDRSQALRLFTAGSTNSRIGDNARASFLETAADYELLAYADIGSAIQFLKRAVGVAPFRKGLREKLDSLERANEHADMSSEGEAHAR